VGTRNTLDVLDAEQEVLEAKLSVVQAERNLNVATYQLLGTLGGFDAYALQLPVELYDPAINLRDQQVIGLGPQIRDYIKIDRKNVLEFNEVDPEKIVPVPQPEITQEK